MNATLAPDRAKEIGRKLGISIATVYAVATELGVAHEWTSMPQPVQISPENYRIGGWRIDLGRKYDYPSTRAQEEACNWHIRSPSGAFLDAKDGLEEAFAYVRDRYGTVA